MKLSQTTEAVIRHQQLLSQIMRPATLSLLQKVKVKAGIRALCLNCGEGNIVFHLSGLTGKNGSVIGIDPSGENIHTAQQLAHIKHIVNATFYTMEQYGQGREQQFELIYSCLPLTQFYGPAAFIDEVQGQLTSGGVALFEVIDFSGFNSIPKNYAFERFLDLYTEFTQTQWGQTPFSKKLNQQLSGFGFQQVQHQYVAPTFLHGTAKHLPSLTLECIQAEILNQKLISADELQVLLFELKDFEQKTNSLISLPGIHQIWGHKT